MNERNEASNDDQAALEAIVRLVQERTRLDFSGYRTLTVERRIRNRMASSGVATVPAYLERLLACDAETAALVDRLMIKVSRFYRNAPAFDLLREAVLPALARPGPVHAWSAGCGRGEEPHTLALLLEDAAIDGSVLATDIDRGALAAGREGVYPDAALEELPRALRERHLEPLANAPGRWRVREAARRRITWRADDLAAPHDEEARFQLICCRNVLIYLQRSLQARVLSRLVASLAPGGYLLLGEAEWPSTAALPALECVAPRSRLFRRPADERIAA